jgi:hypothetical protein
MGCQVEDHYGRCVGTAAKPGVSVEIVIHDAVETLDEL